MSSQDSCQLSTDLCWYSHHFYCYDKDLDLFKQRGLYLDILSYSAAKGENTDMTKSNRHAHTWLWASFVPGMYSHKQQAC